MKSNDDETGGRTASLSFTNEKLKMEIARRKHVEEMLRESENRYRAVVEIQTELICRFRPDYTVTFVNDALCTYFSKCREELMGESFLPLVFEEDRDKIAAFYRTFTPKKTHDTNEHRVILQNREVRWQQWNAAAIFDENGVLVEFQTVGRDITDRLKANEALRDSEERYRIVTKHAADGILVIQKGRLVFVNDAFVAMCGYNDAGKIVGKDATEYIAVPFRKKFIHYMEILDAGIKTEALFRKRVLRRDGEEIWTEGLHTVIQWDGRPAVLCTLRDITKAKQREMETKREAKVLRQQNIKLASTMKDRYRFGNLVGKSEAMQDVYEQILAASSTKANVVVYGESGTGKELVAMAVHEHSDRSENAFVPVNCGAIPENLMESEFFGHKKGAFTGADTDKLGYLDFANRGTLFLDEVGNVSRGVQVKLLRAIEGGGHTPLGSNQVKKSDFRIIAATNRPLMDLVKEGRMREDFFFRVHIVPIYLPPLRERKEDIVLLLDHFIRSMSHGKAHQVLSGKILDAFVEYDWPGNVRELQNVLQRYLTIGRLEFSSGWQARKPLLEDAAAQLQNDGDDFRIKVEGFEKRLMLRSLERCRWRPGLVCKELGIPRRTLFTKMKKYGLYLHKLG
jgi:PAS domain S-box-containing protein